MGGATRFPISFERWYGALSSVLLLRPADSYVEISEDDVVVRMGWAFIAKFSRSQVLWVKPIDGTVLSRGVHGFAGRWLVNGSGTGIVRMALGPAQRARVLGVPVKLVELMVSVNDPDAVVSHLK